MSSCVKLHLLHCHLRVDRYDDGSPPAVVTGVVDAAVRVRGTALIGRVARLLYERPRHAGVLAVLQ